VQRGYESFSNRNRLEKQSSWFFPGGFADSILFLYDDRQCGFDSPWQAGK
jgi:hypothetical protein